MSGGSTERLQKVIARSGLASRRVAEEWIAAGRVSVDGVVAHLGQKVDPELARVEVDGVRLPVRPGLVYYLVNKPPGVTSTTADPHATRPVTELVPAEPRVFPIGRLDVDSEGLLLLTNDGDLANLVTHPRYGVEKTYLARVRGRPDRDAMRKLAGGVDLEDGPAAALRAKLVDRHGDEALVEVVMGEGRKREVRRMLDAVGHPVVRLVRTAIGPLRDRGLKPGEWRPLTVAEVRSLYEAAGRAKMPAMTVVAIDGPGGVGKSTVARRVAAELGLPYLNTGAYYRAATLAALDDDVDLEDGDAVAAAVARRDFAFEDGAMLLDGEDVSAATRTPEVTAAVSAVSAHPPVRRLMVAAQRHWMDRHGGRGVVEGRDIGTVVLPDAKVKVFLDARPEVRAARRAQDREARGVDAAAVQADLARRDRIDSTRETSPLQVADDAVVIDTSDLGIDDVVARVLELASA